MNTGFTGRRLLIATQHRKEQVMAPCLTQALGVVCEVAEQLDTDQLGTFSGEKPRLDDPVSTLRKKCELALAHQPEFDLVVASEGSFGPHPSMFFVPANEEWVMLIDRAQGLEISARQVSTDTNFSAKQVMSWSELQSFASAAQFPTHGLILRPSQSVYSPIFKGVNHEAALRQAFECLADSAEGMYVETDMRALFNPSRMAVIEQTTLQLIEKIQSTCPKCATPGFDLVEVKRGLPCAACGLPTASARSHIYGCQHCGYQDDRPTPLNKDYEDPRYCGFCNP